MNWGHDELAQDLAISRRECGEIAAERLTTGPGYGRSGQVDVFSIKPSWTTPMPTCWEVKVTRSDFLSDVRAAKFERYLPHCRKLYFATPKGLLTKDEIPQGMGLTVRGNNGWHVVKAPRLRKVDPDTHAITLMALLMRLNGPLSSSAVLTREERIRRYDETENAAQRLSTTVRKSMDEIRAHGWKREHLRDKFAHLLGDDEPGERTLEELAEELVSQAPVRVQVPDAIKGATINIRRAINDLQAAVRVTEEIVRRTER